jgi:hypothetical protein
MATCMDLWIHCMLCGSEWKPERQRPRQIHPEVYTVTVVETEKVATKSFVREEKDLEPGERDLLKPQQ